MGVIYIVMDEDRDPPLDLTLVSWSRDVVRDLRSASIKCSRNDEITAGFQRDYFFDF